jgi:hypothetical protein
MQQRKLICRQMATMSLRSCSLDDGTVWVQVPQLTELLLQFLT